MKLATFLVVFILIVAILPVYGMYYLTSENFAEPKIDFYPDKNYYLSGEKITIEYVISPKTEDDAVKIMGDTMKSRYYDIYTSLTDTKWDIMVDYVNGPRIYPEVESGSNHAVVEVKYWYSESGKGLDEIRVNVSGTLPKISKRIETETILWFDVSDSEENALPAVNVTIVNKENFMLDIEKLENEIKCAKSKIEEYKNYDLTLAEKYLTRAEEILSIAKDLFSDEQYLESSEKLDMVSANLSNVYKEINKSLANFEYEKLQKSFNELESKIVKAEFYLKSLKEKGFDVVSFEIQLTKIKSDAASISSEIDDLKNYIKDGKYSDALEKCKLIFDEVNKSKNLTQSVLDSLIKLKEERKTFFDTIVLYFGKFSIYLLAICAVVVAIIAILYLRGRRGRRWDELR